MLGDGPFDQFNQLRSNENNKQFDNYFISLLYIMNEDSESNDIVLQQQSFYNTFDVAEFDNEPSVLEVIQIPKQEDVQRSLHENQALITNKKYIVVNPVTKKYETLYLTNYRVLYSKPNLVSLPYGYIQQIKSNQKFLRILLKTGIYFDFVFDINQKQKQFQDSALLAMYGVPFCFSALGQSEYPTIYDSFAEIERMRVDSQKYKVYKNSSFDFCSTYPLYFLIPKSIDVKKIEQVKKCRMFSRVPVMSFYHEKTGVGIWRGSKKKNDISKETLKFDSSYLRSIPGELIVLEIETNVKKSSLNFQSLDGVRQNYKDLIREYHCSIKQFEEAKNTMNIFKQFSKINENLLKQLGKWYIQVDNLISIAYSVVDFLNSSNHVLIQQIYSFDRVPQIIGLAQIIIDPFFRTFDGFSILVEKQFISYGHPFQERCFYHRNRESQVSPIFIQFLECVNQLAVAHPTCFEYTPAYLGKIGYEVYTNKYKNFLNKNGDVSKEKLFTRSRMSIWEKMEKKLEDRNIWYKKSTNRELWEIRKKPSIKQYQSWKEYLETICKMEGQSKI